MSPISKCLPFISHYIHALISYTLVSQPYPSSVISNLDSDSAIEPLPQVEFRGASASAAEVYTAPRSLSGQGERFHGVSELENADCEVMGERLVGASNDCGIAKSNDTSLIVVNRRVGNMIEDGLVSLLSEEFSRRASTAGALNGIRIGEDCCNKPTVQEPKDNEARIGATSECAQPPTLELSLENEDAAQEVASEIEQSSAVSSGDLVLAINSGGSLLRSSSQCIEFLEDQLYSGGSVLRTHEVISGTEDPTLYQTARYGDVTYTIAMLECREYKIDLHFAEIVFTNGPPGMRVFDVYVQGQKVISDLDVYAEVGSNEALILSTRALVGDDGLLSISFKGVIGSPTISAICVQGAPSADLDNSRELETSGNNEMTVDGSKDVLAKGRQDYAECASEGRSAFPFMKFVSKSPQRAIQSGATVEELKNECHQAWISLQDANYTIERLQNELISKSLTVDTLACAVESQENELREVREKDTLKRKIALVNLVTEFEGFKHQFNVFAIDTKDWIKSVQDVAVNFNSIQMLVTENEDLKKRYAEECQARKQLYNKVLELKGNIRVFCRCRPLNSFESSSGALSVVEFDSVKDNDLIVRTGNSKKIFKFDRVFTPQDGQVEVFGSTAPVVVSVLDGYNVCIFAYGQTGTGKTFTMEGCPENRGVNYRTLEELFHVADQRKHEFNYEISVSALEVYNEQIRDLLAPPSLPNQPAKKLEVKQGVDGGQHVPGLVEATMHSIAEVWEILQLGSSARAVGSTNANEHSSRSHCMLCVMVKGHNLLTAEHTRSKLWLVDLAGSERVAKTDVHGERLKEAQCINKSLSALGDVIYALTTKSSHIPFRNSKLTHILQDSLGGDSKALMFVQISPSEDDIGESLCSLNFASRVRGVELGPARKQIDTTELFKYKQLAERAKLEGRGRDEAMKKLEENLRATETKLKMKEHMYQSLLDKMKDKDRAMAELEMQVASERRSRTAADAVKSFHLEKGPGKTTERRPLLDKTDNGEGIIQRGGSSTFSSGDHGKTQNENTDPQENELCYPSKTSRVKVVPSRYNSPTPLKKVQRRPMRASIASTYTVKPSSLLDTSSDDRGGADAYKEHARAIMPTNSLINEPGEGIGTLVAWKKVRGVPPSSMNRPGIPHPGRRSVRFASPVLEKEAIDELKSQEQTTIFAGNHFPDRRLSGFLDPKKVGVAKLRRLSIAGRPFVRLQAGVTGAQRVWKGGEGLQRNSSTTNVHQQMRERRWNK